MSVPYLPMAEILTRYPDRWVLIDRPKTDRYQQMLGGYVVFDSTDRNSIDAEIDQLPKPFNIAVWYTGDITEDVFLNYELPL